uniref:Uncharacterized protein n=1 Tax=Setaria italica TaxID=4555 RepID=K3YKS9_SETIT
MDKDGYCKECSLYDSNCLSELETRIGRSVTVTFLVSCSIDVFM